jgi:GT2 family glycosyltransferase/MoaA/NifB/PqqE/SkfB family radical SAM enzyme
MHSDAAAGLVAPTPRTFWLELTSKCPFDCLFCSRESRRGAGEHLPFGAVSTLLDSLVDARRLVLNYSGESLVYPDLLPAIERAAATGAYLELVTVLAVAPEPLLEALSRSGLRRLTVSVHATNPQAFATIYRHSSFEVLEARLRRLLEFCRSAPRPPLVDLAFVAMESNLGELGDVTALAEDLGLQHVMVFPVMRRDECPGEFPAELSSQGLHRPDFARRVREGAARAAERHASVRISICNPGFTIDTPELGAVPMPFPFTLPEGAHIHSCEQNPWETAHVLSNGDVVACEVLDKAPLGNLHTQSLAAIWHGDAYRTFRARYRRGEIPECRTCPWKSAFRPQPLASQILATRGFHAQLHYGWHEPAGEPHVWSSRQAAAVLAPRPGSSTLHVSGILPPGAGGEPNHLTIRLNGAEIGRVTNPWEELMPFGLDFPAGGQGDSPWLIEFRTSQVFRPAERGAGTDQRDLGFALFLAASQEPHDPPGTARRRELLEPLRALIETTDCWGQRLARRWRRRPARPGWGWRPGISVLIPEWDNAEELGACLASVAQAALRWAEPLETLVVVNGSERARYAGLQSAYPQVRWSFHPRPLGFAGAVRAGLRMVRYDWVYLLNSDVVLDPGALAELAPLRASGTFSAGSQILLKDRTCFRDETNWGVLAVEDGLAAIADWIPRSTGPAPAFYGGGGATLFRAALLRKLLDASAYHPFYWEDVEWGWRARKLGCESWFCPASVVHHSRRSTIGKKHPPGEVERILRRNALLFQLRNFTTAGSLERLMESMARSAGVPEECFLTTASRLKIVRGRLWNHLAPLSDEEVFARWNSSISNY